MSRAEVAVSSGDGLDGVAGNWARYNAPAADPSAAFGHAMIYQAAVFALAAVARAVLCRGRAPVTASSLTACR